MDNTQEDTFEDAHDAAPETPTVRSLTERSPSNPRQSVPESETNGAVKKDEPEEEHMMEPVVSADADQLSDDGTEDKFEEVETTIDDDDDLTLGQQSRPSVSPTQRISVTSNSQLDNISLDDENSAGKQGALTTSHQCPILISLTDLPYCIEQEHPKESPSEPEPEPPKKTISLSSLTNSLPSMPWSPGAQTSPTKTLDAPPTPAAPPSPGPPPASTTTPAPPPPRKLAGAFSWLSRSSSKDLTNVSPPVVSPRRNTASSTTTLASNPEMMLGKLEEEGANGARNVRNSLKDRFKAMRMREEAGITRLPDDGDKNGIAGLVNKGPNGISITPAPDEKDASAQPPPSPLPSQANLAPGTASGAAAGPSTLSDQPVDWDLWQSVVYEGPAAVAKTSAEELNRAIATGIPSAIRGVIWQVLAQSQSEELEAVYRDLVARGTDKEKDRLSDGSFAAGSNSSSIKEPGSSASSIHSGNSGSQVNGGAPSPPPKDDEVTRAKKKKEDWEMISRLEKTIRRDLGARTAYSKFASAQGLQEGLFGVCKAYALFDEEVGYAQGMNFLIMPLLFNVSL